MQVATDTIRRVVSAEALAGGYRIEAISLGPQFRGHHVVGTIWLWPALSTDSSMKTRKHAAPGDSTWHPYFGATDIQFWTMKTDGPADETTLRERTDPIFPEVIVTSGHGVSHGHEWQDITLWIGSVANVRDGTMGLDGAGYDMHIEARDEHGFRGRWGPAGIVVTDRGYFCALRIREAQ